MESHENCSWSRSFELVYHDPSPKYRGRTYFRDPENDLLTTEQRIAYVQAYADLLRQENDLGDDWLSSEVVSETEARQVVSQIKDRPLPRLRQVVPLRFWRWKLQGEEKDDWVEPGFDDSLWNEMEVPTVLDMGRAMLLRSQERIESSERVMIDIESIHDEYELWVNGQAVAHHEGYEPHTVDITSFVRAGQENTFAIRVAKKRGYQTGIAGSIQVVGTRSCFIEDVFVKPLEAEEGRPARLQINATVRNASCEGFAGELSVLFYRWFPEEDSAVAYEMPPVDLEIGPGQEMQLSRECAWSGAELWRPDRPRLYRFEAVLNSGSGEQIDDYVDTVGIRTIEQRAAKFYLNGRRFVLRSFGDNLGFAPGADSHSSVCPPDDWIVRDFLLARGANANCIRLHPWGYAERLGEHNELGFPEWDVPTDGTNYARFAEIADQLGICLIWVTRHWTLWGQGFREHYREDDMERLLAPSIKRVRNHPSIISYEGFNSIGITVSTGVLQAHLGSASTEDRWVENLSPQEVETLAQLHVRRYIDFCSKFIRLVDEVDNSRLVCPDSKWGPPLMHDPQFPSTVQHEDMSVFTLTENVYWELHEYPGWYAEFSDMYDQRDRLLPDDRARAVFWSEFSAEAMPDWQRYQGLPWRNIWINHDRPNAAIETARLGRPLRALRDSEAHLSQAYQGLFFQQVSAFGRASGCEGMNYQLITDGLSRGMYHKGVCDLYRHAKLGYFAARMAYQPTVVTGMDGDFVLAEDDALHPVLINDDVERIGRQVQVHVEVKRLDGTQVDSTDINAAIDDSGIVKLADYRPRFPAAGLYQITYEVSPKD